jgi:hypothetical protein
VPLSSALSPTRHRQGETDGSYPGSPMDTAECPWRRPVRGVRSAFDEVWSAYPAAAVPGPAP